MFTGIIIDVGEVIKVADGGMFTVRTRLPAERLSIGTSIAMNGACMTVVEQSGDTFVIHASPESLAKTSMGSWQEGEQINLEPSLRLGDEMAGHYVTGHVDALATVKSIEQEDNGNWIFTVQPPTGFEHFIAPKGSVTLNGVALTVNDVNADGSFTINIIPHTYKETNFNRLKEKSHLNFEVDPLARYTARLLETGAKHVA